MPVVEKTDNDNESVVCAEPDIVGVITRLEPYEADATVDARQDTLRH